MTTARTLRRAFRLEGAALLFVALCAIGSVATGWAIFDVIGPLLVGVAMVGLVVLVVLVIARIVTVSRQR